MSVKKYRHNTEVCSFERRLMYFISILEYVNSDKKHYLGFPRVRKILT